MIKAGMECPVCGQGKLKKIEKDVKFEYKKKKMVVAGCSLFSCGDCAEEFMSSRESRRLEKILTDHRREVDSLLTSDQIRTIRTSLGFSQKALANILGVGEKNFARYETGRVTQSRVTDHLLRVIYEYPFVLEIIHKSKVESVGKFSAILKESELVGAYRVEDYEVHIDMGECAIATG